MTYFANTKKEFCLSDKVFWNEKGNREPSLHSKQRIFAKDVKEFIRLLKKFHWNNGDVYGEIPFIDALAREELI